MDIGDIVIISEKVAGKVSGNHYGLEGFEGEILRIDLTDNTAYVEIFKTKQKLWLKVEGLTVLKGRKRCSCGGIIQDVPLFTSIIKICSDCKKEEK